MKAPLQIGITGGIGSGKSLVCRVFASLGVPVYDADRHAKELMTTDGILISAIREQFGDLSYNADGSLNRVWLAQHVFSNADRLERLNSLVHPRVGIHYQHWVAEHGGVPYVLKEAALLFESGSYKALDRIIVVTAPLQVRQGRVLARDPHRTVEQFHEIVEKQMPEEEKMKHAHYIIVNDDHTMVIPQVLALHRKFMAGLQDLR